MNDLNPSHASNPSSAAPVGAGSSVGAGSFAQAGSAPLDSAPYDSAPFTANGSAISEAAFQALALNTQQNVVIEACAGSGKTWLLVARILKLLIQGVAPSQIVAITFTRKAAQEMKARLADMLDSVYHSPHGEGAGLLAALNMAGGSPKPFATGNATMAGSTAATSTAIALAWQRCFEQGQWPGLLTFHEWFGELRQDTPLSNLANAGAVLCDDETLLRTQAWQQFWQDSRDAPMLRSAMLTAVAQLGLNGFEHALNAFLDRRAEWLVYAAHLHSQALKGAAHKIPSSAQLAQAAFVAHTQPASTAQLWAALRALAPRLNAVAKQYAQSKTATPLARGQALLAAIERLTQAPEPFEAAAPTESIESIEPIEPSAVSGFQSHIMRLMHPLSMATGAVVNTKVYKDMLPHLSDFAGGSAGFEAQIDGLHAALQSLHHQASVLRLIPTHEAMLVCGAHLVAVYQANKQALGLLDFTDLEIDALSVLTQSLQPVPAFQALATEKSPVRHVLLDEFQDTNPVQWQSLQAFLLPLLNEAKAGGQSASVCVVGDPKQSIYRFRRADPQLFSHVQRSLQADFGAALLKTQRTRRNSTAVNQWVNAVFAPASVALNAHANDNANSLFSPQFTLSPQQGRIGVLPLLDAAALEAGECEAQQVVCALQAWKARQPQLDWSQAMVLARKRQALAPIAAALRAHGIASVSAERGGFFAQAEIADVMHLLAALNNPADVLALLSALRSPLFALSDAQLSELLAHASAAPSVPWLGIADLAAPWAQGVSAWLTAWHALSTQLPMHDALDAMMHQAQWLQRFAAADPARSEAIAANLAQLLQLALSVNQGRYPSLARFVQAVAQLRDSNALAAQSGAAINAVRLLTIHGAKGLEADCVVMVDLYAKDKPDDTLKVLLDWPAQQGYPRLFALQLCPAPVLSAITPLAQVLAAQEQARLQERDTLLYVAMTRAVSELWVSATAKRNSLTVYERLSQAFALHTDSAAQGGLEPLETPAARAAKPEGFASGAAWTLPLAPIVPPTLFAPPTPPIPAAPLYSLPAPALRLGTINTRVAPQVNVKALGTLMHSLFEQALRRGVWHSDTALSALANTLCIAQADAQHLSTQCQAMAGALNLLGLRDSASHLAIEETLVFQGQRLRPDVVAYCASEHTAWVLDFKYSFSPTHGAAQAYAEQLQVYSQAVSAAGYADTSALLLTLAGECWQFQNNEWRVCNPPWR